HQTCLVHSRHSDSQLSSEDKRIFGSGSPAVAPEMVETIPHRSSVGEFEHEVGLEPLRFSDIVDGDDVSPTHSSKASSFGDEAFADLGIEAVVLCEDLDRHGVVETLVNGAVHGRE